jgi:hypothetical protein
LIKNKKLNLARFLQIIHQRTPMADSSQQYDECSVIDHPAWFADKGVHTVTAVWMLFFD